MADPDVGVDCIWVRDSMEEKAVPHALNLQNVGVTNNPIFSSISRGECVRAV